MLLLFCVPPFVSTAGSCDCLAGSVTSNSCDADKDPACGSFSDCICVEPSVAAAGICECLSSGIVTRRSCKSGKEAVCGNGKSCSCLDKEECDCSTSGNVQTDSCDSRGQGKEGVCLNSGTCACVQKLSSLGPDACDCVSNQVVVENCSTNKNAACIDGSCVCLTKEPEALEGTCVCIGPSLISNSCGGDSSPSCKKTGCSCFSFSGAAGIASTWWLMYSGFFVAVILMAL